MKNGTCCNYDPIDNAASEIVDGLLFPDSERAVMDRAYIAGVIRKHLARPDHCVYVRRTVICELHEQSAPWWRRLARRFKCNRKGNQ